MNKEHAVFVNSKNNSEGIERVMKLLSVGDDDDDDNDMDTIPHNSQREFWVGDDLKDFEQYGHEDEEQQKQQHQQQQQQQQKQQQGGNPTKMRVSAASPAAASATPAATSGASKMSFKNPFRSSTKIIKNNNNNNDASKVPSISEEVASLDSTSSSLAAYSTASWKKIGRFAGFSPLTKAGGSKNHNDNHADNNDKKKRSHSLIPRRRQQQQQQQRKDSSPLESQKGATRGKKYIHDRDNDTLEKENNQDKHMKKVRGRSLPPLKHNQHHQKGISHPSNNTKGNVKVRPVPFHQESTNVVGGNFREHPLPSFQHHDTQDTAVCNSIGSNGTTASNTQGSGDNPIHIEHVNENQKGSVVSVTRGESQDRGRSRSCSSSRNDIANPSTESSFVPDATRPMEEAKKSRRSFSLTPMKSKMGLLLLSSKQNSAKSMMVTTTTTTAKSSSTKLVQNRGKSLPRLSKKSSSNSNATPPKLFPYDQFDNTNNIDARSHRPQQVDESNGPWPPASSSSNQIHLSKQHSDSNYSSNNRNTTTAGNTSPAGNTAVPKATTKNTTKTKTPKHHANNNNNNHTKKSKPRIHCVICKRRLHSNQYVEFCNLHFCDASHGRDGTSCFKCATCHCSLDNIVSALNGRTNNIDNNNSSSSNGISANDAFLRWTKVISNSRGSVVQCGRCAMGAAFPSTSYYCPDNGNNEKNGNNIIHDSREESCPVVALGSGPGSGSASASAAAAAPACVGEEENENHHHHFHHHVHHQDGVNQEYSDKKRSCCDPPSISDEEDFCDSTAAVAAAKLSTNNTIVLHNHNNHQEKANSVKNKLAPISSPISSSSVSSISNNTAIGNSSFTLQPLQQQQQQQQQNDINDQNYHHHHHQQQQQQQQRHIQILHNQTQKYHQENTQLKIQNHQLTNTVTELSTLNTQNKVREAELLQRIAVLDRENMKLKDEKSELEMDLEEVVLENDSLKFVLAKVRERLECDDDGIGGGDGDGDGISNFGDGDDNERYGQGESRDGYGNGIHDTNGTGWVRSSAMMGRRDTDHRYSKRNCINGIYDI